jgi:sugar porter (SP) family MFS transporter
MHRKLYTYTFIAALGGLLFGFDTAVINGAMPFFTDYFQLTEAMQGWTVSSALVGCIIGALFVGKPGDIFGRRRMLRFLALLFLISALGTGLASNLTWFVLFRFIGGLAVGGSSVLSPMYISEIAPPRSRGRLTITFQLAIVIGILVAFFSDYLLLNTGANNWRWMFIMEGFPALAFFALLFMVSKSPRWLVKNGDLENARQVIVEVNPEANVEMVLEDIKQSIDNEIISKSIYLFRKPFLKLVIIGIMIGFFNQFTGINIIMYYATDIFRSVGFSTDSAIGQTVIIGFTNLVFTLVAMKVIDQFGRKSLLLVGSLGMTVFLGLFAWAYISGAIESFILLVFLIGFIAFFASSQGAVIWVLLAEMFPNNVRARGTAIGSFSHWFSMA